MLARALLRGPALAARFSVLDSVCSLQAFENQAGLHARLLLSIRSCQPVSLVNGPERAYVSSADSVSALHRSGCHTASVSSRSFASLPVEQEAQEAQESANFPEPVDVLSRFNAGPSSDTNPLEFPFNAKAYYLGNKLDIYALNETEEFKKFPHSLGRDSTLLCLTPRRRKELSEHEQVTGLPLETYLVAFKYGSVVLFNASGKEAEILELCRRHALNLTRRDFSEELRVTVRPDMEVASTHDPDHIMLQQLDFNNMKTISHVLGQSVALDYYAQRAETMLDQFCEMNLDMQRTGDFTALNKTQLLQMVAENNVIITDIIAKLRLHDRFDIAWKFGQYGRIFEHLRDELEMENRFRILDMKLTLIQENLKYFLEIMQNKKSDTLEWIIIILIAAEIAVGCYDMWTKGTFPGQ